MENGEERNIRSLCWIGDEYVDERAKKWVRADSELSEEFEVNVGMNHGSVLSPFLFAFVVDFVTEFESAE